MPRTYWTRTQTIRHGDIGGSKARGNVWSGITVPQSLGAEAGTEPNLASQDEQQQAGKYVIAGHHIGWSWTDNSRHICAATQRFWQHEAVLHEHVDAVDETASFRYIRPNRFDVRPHIQQQSHFIAQTRYCSRFSESKFSNDCFPLVIGETCRCW